VRISKSDERLAEIAIVRAAQRIEDQHATLLGVESLRLANAGACRRAFEITQDRPLSGGNRRVIGAVDVLAFLEAQNRLDDARSENRRVVAAFEHEEGRALAILCGNFSNDPAKLTLTADSRSSVRSRSGVCRDC
jgi:hypothetical protein